LNISEDRMKRIDFRIENIEKNIEKQIALNFDIDLPLPS
jgi:hypothetical protein